MKQKYTEIAYKIDVAQKIQQGEIPGFIIDKNRRNVRVIDFSHSDTSVLAMTMNDVMEEDETVYLKDELLLLVPEWYTFSAGDVVMCEQRYGDCVIEFLAILRIRPNYLTTNRVYIYSLAKCITCGSVDILDVDTSTCHTVRLANEVERKLFAERLKQNASGPALTMLAKYLPEYSNVKQPQHNE